MIYLSAQQIDHLFALGAFMDEDWAQWVMERKILQFDRFDAVSSDGRPPAIIDEQGRVRGESGEVDVVLNTIQRNGVTLYVIGPLLEAIETAYPYHTQELEPILAQAEAGDVLIYKRGGIGKLGITVRIAPTHTTIEGTGGYYTIGNPSICDVRGMSERGRKAVLNLAVLFTDVYQLYQTVTTTSSPVTHVR